VVLVAGSRDDVEGLRDEVARVLAPMGLRCRKRRRRSCTSTRASTSWVMPTPRYADLAGKLLVGGGDRACEVGIITALKER